MFISFLERITAYCCLLSFGLDVVPGGGERTSEAKGILKDPASSVTSFYTCYLSARWMLLRAKRDAARKSL